MKKNHSMHSLHLDFTAVRQLQPDHVNNIVMVTLSRVICEFNRAAVESTRSLIGFYYRSQGRTYCTRAVIMIVIYDSRCRDETLSALIILVLTITPGTWG